MTWITVKEAAERMGYSEDYFRRTFCDPAKPLVPLRQRGPKCRIQVLESAVEILITVTIKHPA